MFAIAIHGGAGTLSRSETSYEQERAYLQDAKNVAQLRSDRAKSRMGEKYCWK